MKNNVDVIILIVIGICIKKDVLLLQVLAAFG